MNKIINNLLFGASGHAAIYAKYRVKPPTRIFDYILSYLGQRISPPFRHAMDVGCGNGQSTEMLAVHFDNVTGMDISESQIDEAIRKNKFNNISYQKVNFKINFGVGTETELLFEKNSLQLITASQCHHWLELPLFYEQVKRVLVPKGVLSIYFYQTPLLIDEENPGSNVEGALHYIDKVEMKEYWDERRKTIDQGLNGFHFPFQDIVNEHFTVDNVCTVSDVCGYIQSWSPYQAMLRDQPEKAKRVIDDLREKLLASIISNERNPDKVNITIRYPYCLIMGRTE